MKRCILAACVTLLSAHCGQTDEAIAPSPAVDAGPPDAGSAFTATCADADLLQCGTPRCVVSGPRGTLGAGQQIVIRETAVSPRFAIDAVAPVACDVIAPPTLAGVLTLGIALDATPPPDATLFSFSDSGPPALVNSSVKDNRVQGLVTTSGTFAVTRATGTWRVGGAVESEPLTSRDPASLLRNISSSALSAAFYDGSRLYVASGNRILIYDGLPPSPTTAPTVILGQPTIDAAVIGTSAALLSGGIGGIWSNGTRLVVSTGNRVLIWNTVPQSNFAPADLVLGQPDFATSTPNFGGLSASTLSFPRGIDSDGTKLLVADALNHRVLVWNTFPQSIAQPANVVVGQPTFTSNAPGTPPLAINQAFGAILQGSSQAFVSGMFSGAARVGITTNNAAADFAVATQASKVTSGTLGQASSIARTQGGGLAVADPFGNRIAVYRAVPTSGPSAMHFALGQPDSLRTVSSPVSASTFSRDAQSPSGIASGGGLFLVPDGSRILVYESSPAYNFEPASRVIGQAGFTTNQQGIDYRRISARTMGQPADVAVDGTRVAVADRGNNRVLLFPVSALGAATPAATVVLGQPDDKSYVPNLDQRSPDATRLSGPSGVALAGNRLIVADTENHRVLIWSQVPTASGAAADIVLGQADFQARRPNRGRGDQNQDGYSDADADGFFAPMGVASDGTRLFVADRLNHRVLVWDAFPTSSGQSASRVIGQNAATVTTANRGNGPYAPASDGFNLPTDLLLVGASLYVADTENNRVVRWDGVDTNAPTAAAFFGQPNGTTVSNLNYQNVGSTNEGYISVVSPTASNVVRPRGLALSNGTLFVAEADTHRVHMFNASNGASQGVLGQANESSGTQNAGGTSSRALAGPWGMATDGTRLLVADSGNHRVLGFPLANLATNADANIVLGQPTFGSSGFNQSLPSSSGGGTRPSGLARFGNELFIAETDRNRVTVRELPIASPSVIKRVIGQPSDTSTAPNAGGAPSARTLRGPRGVFVDAAHMLVADTGNHRVLVWDKAGASPDATRVLGQSTFTDAIANRGATASLATMNAPEGVWFDGTRLFVADTGNHRVLVWNAFPTADGQPADVVLGQSQPDAVLPNRGQSGPQAPTMFSPSSVLSTGQRTFVADRGNNRVLVFSDGVTTGMAATTVLGQADLASRATTADPADLQRLASPSALSEDGANLYVADRDLGRVVVYPGFGSQTNANLTVGPLGGLVLRAPMGVVAEPTPFFTTRLYVSDTNGDRIMVVESVPRIR